jgi:hypothetical protein
VSVSRVCQSIEERRGGYSGRGDASSSGQFIRALARRCAVCLRGHRGAWRLRRCPHYVVLCAVDGNHRFAQGTHALDQVHGAWRWAVPEHDEDVFRLAHLVIAPHASGLPESLPVRAEALVCDHVLPGPTVAERLRAPVIRKNYGNDVLPEANYAVLGRRCHSVREYLRVDKL